MRTLVVVSRSPFSERAAWALEHHRLAYRQIEHVPMLGELALRARAGKWSGKVSAPLLIEEDGRAIGESVDIARHADAIGQGAPLFPETHLGAIRTLCARSDRALAAGRRLLFDRLAHDRGALLEGLPDFARPFGAASLPVARAAVSFLARKYASVTPNDPGAALVEELETLRATLAGRATIFPEFTFADIAMSGILQFVSPVATHMPLGPEMRACWGDQALAVRFADLVDWRDRLYAKYR